MILQWLLCIVSSIVTVIIQCDTSKKCNYFAFDARRPIRPCTEVRLQTCFNINYLCDYRVEERCLLGYYLVSISGISKFERNIRNFIHRGIIFSFYHCYIFFIYFLVV